MEKLLYNGEIYIRADSNGGNQSPAQISYNGKIYVKADSSDAPNENKKISESLNRLKKEIESFESFLDSLPKA